MSKTIHPDNFLIAMVHYLPEGRRCFKYDSKKLNIFLYEQKKQHPNVLDSFEFNWNGTWPTSRELEQAISNMFASGLIATLSTLPIDYHFDPACEDSYQRFVKDRISSEKLSKIEAIAHAFNEQIAIDERFSIHRR